MSFIEFKHIGKKYAGAEHKSVDDFNLNIEEKELLNTGTVTRQDIEQNLDVINNINIYNKKRVLSHLEEYQTSSGYYTFDSTRNRSI